jgi:acyl carrier protein
MDAVKMGEDLNDQFIEKSVKEFILENFLILDSEVLADDESLLEKGIIDSTGVLELVAFLEGNFGIKVEDEELIPQNLDTIVNIIEFVRKKRQSQLIQLKGKNVNAASTLS